MLSSSYNASPTARLASTIGALYEREIHDFETASVGAAYALFILTVGLVLWQISDLNFSVVCTIGSGLQCLAFALLSMKMRAAKSACGISAKSLWLYVVVYCSRLTSTLCLEGYIPMDSTGDWVYQLADIVSLILVLLILQRLYTTDRGTYDAEADTCQIWPFLAGALVVAAITRGDLNDSLFFDMAWMMSVAVDTVAMVPQLWLLSKLGGTVDALTSHFVALLFLSRALTFAFWFYGYPELAPLDNSFNACGYAHVCLHFAQLLLCADFMYYYLKSTIKQEAMVLPELDV